MGVCCGKDAMPVVDDDLGSPAGNQSTPIPFDYVYKARSDGDAPMTPLGAAHQDLTATLRRPARNAATPQPPEVAYTPRDLDATTVASGGTIGALSYVTNGNQDVSYDFVGQFVERIRDGDLEGSFMGGTASVAGTQASRGSGPSLGGTLRGPRLTKEHSVYLAEPTDFRTKVARLVELEEMYRIEIWGAYRMNSMLFTLASQRMVPTVRRRRTSLVTPSASMTETLPKKKSSIDVARERSEADGGKDGKKKSKQEAAQRPPTLPPAIVIHSRDVMIEFNDNDADDFDETLHDLGETNASVVFTQTQVADDDNFSPREATAAGGALSNHREGGEVPNASQERRKSVLSSNAAIAAPPQTVVEHYEMLTLSGREISLTANVKGLCINESWDFLSLPKTAPQLNSGSAMYRFLSKPVSSLGEVDMEILNMFVNVSSFQNEQVENNVPICNFADASERAKYVAILAKAMYILPGVRLATINRELMASLDYQRNCQAGESKFYDNIATPFTFRQSKTIVKFLFSIVIQMKVSEVTDPAILQSFRNFDGIVPAKALLLERTKNNMKNVDSTAKCKSLLLYYPINDGLLVSHVTVVLNTSLPTVISKVLDTFGGQGAKENADTVSKTRRYMIHRFGDSREGLSSFQ